MSYRRLSSYTLPAVLAVGCTLGAGGTATSQPLPGATAGTPSTAATASATTASAAPSTTVGGTPAPATPTPGASRSTGIARSDAFWGPLASGGIAAYHYASLSELNRAADLVALTRVTGIREGRRSCEPDGTDCSYFADVEMEVLEVLSGEPPEGPLVAEFLVGGSTIVEIKGGLMDIPEERAIFFLRDLDKEARSLDLPADLIISVEGKYRWSVFQAAIRDDHGTARPMPYAELDYLLAVDGRPFERVLDSVR